MRSPKHYDYRAKFNLAPFMDTSFPVHVDIELAGKCNLRCVMCPYGDNGDGTGSFDESMQGMMPSHIAKQAIDQAHSGGAKSIKFNFRGEPGMSKFLVNAVSHAKNKGFTELAINTNLLAFSRRRLEMLCGSGLDLMIVSIDGASKEVYEKIRIKGDYDRLIENLEFVRQQPVRPRVRLQMVVQNLNKHETKALHEKLRRYGDEIVLQQERSQNTGERKRCPQPWQRLIVAWDGTVFACCSNWANEWPVGKFPDQTLGYIWNRSPQLMGLRKTATEFDGFPCKDCKVGVSYR